jgi:hypothetical protein
VLRVDICGRKGVIVSNTVVGNHFENGNLVIILKNIIVLVTIWKNYKDGNCFEDKNFEFSMGITSHGNKFEYVLYSCTLIRKFVCKCVM